ncbi:hypothetical protein P8R33_13930 [Qipengyuania sp. XHP0211]|uniref:hypothetical protein n=1 Tax=Qipengyuania sp. XHP0211 TaxID=3038079 RepID=UPI00241F7EB5|nr:hypothetical protein [Qipengyuania sp. XHP0211]MDG5752209.1 hypothetical protein [Qipengyuania sp. XHP0211]
MKILDRLDMITIARILVAIGLLLALAKWFLDMDRIGNWTLVFLIPGVILTFLGNRRATRSSDD